jgi:CheY-like chemotaxis protein
MLMGIINVTGVRAEEKRQNLVVNLNANVPSFIISDELRLSQVITNLLTNAVKFTPENGKITLSVEKSDGSDAEITLRIEVADTGIGISTEQQKRLFTSYNQANNSISGKFGGTGLGLVISKRIVELMRGEIWIESELNKGSKFIFTIKAKKGTDKVKTESSAQISNAEQKKDTSKQGGTGETGFNFKGRTILIAEDMEFNREIIAKYLGKTGVSVAFAENGKEAVSMFKDHPDKYSLILMDIHMPEMDGYEATGAIRALESERAKDITIIAMTANVFKEDVEKCLEAGMNDHIGKPIFPKDIYEKLKKYLT